MVEVSTISGPLIHSLIHNVNYGTLYGICEFPHRNAVSKSKMDLKMSVENDRIKS